MTFFELILTPKYKSTIVNLNATICIASDVSETNVIKIDMLVKNFLLALVHSTVVDMTQSTILVIVPVDAGFFGVYKPISSIRSTFVLHLTFRFGLLMDIDKLALGIAY